MGFRGYFERKKHFIDSIPPAIQNLRDLLTLGDDVFPYPYMMDMLKRLTLLPQFAHIEKPAANRTDGLKIAEKMFIRLIFRWSCYITLNMMGKGPFGSACL